jgi:hypothetical protein
MTRNWLAYQRQIAMLLAATPRTSSTWNDRQCIQLQAMPPLDSDPAYERRGADRDSRRLALPGIQRR